MTADRITTAAELDTLPIGSIILDTHRDPWMRDGHDWIAPETSRATSDTVARKWGPLTVIHIPDRDLLAEAWARGAREALDQVRGDLRADALVRSYESGSYTAHEVFILAARYTPKWVARARAEQAGGGD